MTRKRTEVEVDIGDIETDDLVEELKLRGELEAARRDRDYIEAALDALYRGDPHAAIAELEACRSRDPGTQARLYKGHMFGADTSYAGT